MSKHTQYSLYEVQFVAVGRGTSAGPTPRHDRLIAAPAVRPSIELTPISLGRAEQGRGSLGNELWSVVRVHQPAQCVKLSGSAGAILAPGIDLKLGPELVFVLDIP